jgi:YidC/Oxa1 family membrane protein insertase
LNPTVYLFRSRDPGCLPSFRPGRKKAAPKGRRRLFRIDCLVTRYRLNHNDGICRPERARRSRCNCSSADDRHVPVFSICSFSWRLVNLGENIEIDLALQISTFRTQSLRFPSQRGKLKSALSGNAPWRMAPAAVGPAAIRFNSTSSTPTPAEFAPDPSPTGQLTDLPDMYDITTIPERIGYLKELGLDYGWGPASVMQYLIEHIHIYSGIPWWASIVAVGVMSRVVLFKAVLGASENAARMTHIRDKIDPLRKKMIELSREGNSQEAQIAKAQMAEINKKHGISVWKSMIPMLQIPLGFGCFRVVRGMASLPVPGVATETVAWLNDLTIPDPIYLLPAIAAGTLALTLKVSWC